MAYYSLEPFGEYRADLRAGILAQVQYDMWKGKDSPAMTASDFMPYLKQEIGEQDEEKAQHDKMLGVAVMMNALMGGQDLRGQ